MITNTTISAPDYKAAHYTVSRIAPALEALQKIDLQTLHYDAEAAEKLAELKQFLADINEQNKAVVFAGDEQYQNRPTKLINKAAARLTEIPICIELEQKKLAAKLETRKMKADELSKRFTQAEVDRIIPPIPKSEADASAAIIAGLKAEAAAIQAFIADSPRFDLELLKNTKLYPSEV